MLMRPERDEGEQAEQGGGGASDSLIGPLALGLDAEMATDLGEGDLGAPAASKPAQDIERIGGGIGAQESPPAGRTLARAHPHRADRDATAGAPPERRGAGKFGPAPGAAT